MKRILYSNSCVLRIENESEIRNINLLTSDLNVLKAVQSAIQTEGIKSVLSELKDSFELKSNNCLGELYHIIFDKAAGRGIYPNHLGCYESIKFLCYAFEFGRIKVQKWSEIN